MTGPKTAFEADFEKKFISLKTKLTKIENKIYRVMNQSLINPHSSKSYWNAVRKELDVLYKQMDIVFIEWSSKNIPERFSKSIRNMMAYINKNKIIVEQASRSYAGLMNTNAMKNVSSILYEDAVVSFLSASSNGKRNMYRLTRLTQQKLIDEGLINLTVAEAAEAGNLSLASGKLHLQLVNALGDKHFVQAGKMKYKASYYAEMVARTKFHDAQAQAALATASNYETDLIQVSSHNTTTRICMPFEGKIFSISGKDKRFPPLTDTSPFHTNCLHNMYPYFESAMEATGTTQAWSDFSMGTTSKPPGMGSFIPLDERISA